jgi:hypothetical protein
VEGDDQLAPVEAGRRWHAAGCFGPTGRWEPASGDGEGESGSGQRKSSGDACSLAGGLGCNTGWLWAAVTRSGGIFMARRGAWQRHPIQATQRGVWHAKWRQRSDERAGREEREADSWVPRDR